AFVFRRTAEIKKVSVQFQADQVAVPKLTVEIEPIVPLGGDAAARLAAQALATLAAPARRQLKAVVVARGPPDRAGIARSGN
ncbi:MAG: hypothetical protein M3O70_06960, partial [Actinomycetota bacterium]|nr:hypothetical protein [Actinomycetota bacterium]